jgi:hypothetical protein
MGQESKPTESGGLTAPSRSGRLLAVYAPPAAIGLLTATLLVWPTLVAGQIAGGLITPGMMSPRKEREMEEAHRQAADPITTVAPVMVRPAEGLPNVGSGATFFSTESLAREMREAQVGFLEAQAAVLQCSLSIRSSDGPHVSKAPQGAGNPDGTASVNDLTENYIASVNASMQPGATELGGRFSIGALYSTEASAQRTLRDAAEVARKATQEAIDAQTTYRANPTAAESAELARQIAVRAFQQAKSAVLEAQARIADLQALIEAEVNGDPGQLRVANDFRELRKRYPSIEVEVNNNSRERTQGNQLAGVYVPQEFKDLRLSNIVSRAVNVDGEAGIRVTGRIQNPLRKPVRVPPLWIAAIDRYGTGLMTEQVTAPRGTKAINAGGSLPFTYTMKPVPLSTSRTIITFAPYHNPPRLKPVSGYCP